MPEVGHLRATLSANTDAFARDMQRARDAVRRNASDMASAMERVGVQFDRTITAIKAIGVIASAGVFSAMVKSAIDAADAMAKASQATGVAIDTLSELTYAAQMSGVESDKLNTALIALSRNITDAASGTGAARDAFAALGISVTDTEGNIRSSADVLRDISQAFSGMEDGAQKTALAVDIFGRSGADLIPLLNGGADGLARMAEEARALGLVMDEDTSAAAERFNDALSRLSAVKRGLVMEIVRKMVPAMDAMAESVDTASGKTSVLREVAEIAAAGLKLLISAAVGVGAAFKGAGHAIGGVLAVLKELMSGNWTGAKTIISSIGDDIASEFRSTITMIDKIWSEHANNPKTKTIIPKKQPQFFKKEQIKTKKTTAVGGKTGKTEKRRADRTEIAISNITKEPVVKDPLAEKAHAVKMEIDELYRAQVVWNELVQMVEAGYLTLDQAAAAYVKKFGGHMDEMARFAADAGQGIQRAFADFLFDPFSKGLDGMLQDFIVVLRRMAAEAVASQVFKLVGQGLGAGQSSGGIGSFLSAFFGGARANGGPVLSGHAYLVGERGPELFVPRESGVIIPNTGVHVVNNFTISAPIDRRTQEQIAQIAGASIRRAMHRSG